MYGVGSFQVTANFGDNLKMEIETEVAKGSKADSTKLKRLKKALKQFDAHGIYAGTNKSSSFKGGPDFATPQKHETTASAAGSQTCVSHRPGGVARLRKGNHFPFSPISTNRQCPRSAPMKFSQTQSLFFNDPENTPQKSHLVSCIQ